MFNKAEKRKSFLRLGLSGPSGSGKTYSALSIASGLGGNIAVIDTERGSASLYANDFEFDVMEISDYRPETFIKAIGGAKISGYSCLIIDSITHVWEGIKDIAESDAHKKGGNSWAGWSAARPVERDFFDAMLTFPGHVLATMRVKTAWETQKDDRGRSKPVKIGLAPEQRNNIESEFTIMLDLDASHCGVVSKTRLKKFTDESVLLPGRDFGERLIESLNEGKPAFLTEDMILSITDAASSSGIPMARIMAYTQAAFKVGRLESVPVGEYQKIIDKIAQVGAGEK